MTDLLKGDRHTNFISLGDTLNIDVEPDSSCLLVLIKDGSKIEKTSLNVGVYKYGPYTEPVRYEITCYSGRIILSSSSNDMPVVNEKKENYILTRNACGVMIPLYIYPTNAYVNADYNAVIDLAKKYYNVPTVAIINPSSGPGATVDGNYVAALKRLKGAGIVVLGYVSTAYMANGVSSVKADVDQWMELYPGIDGIFYDEMKGFADSNITTDEIIRYYKELYNYARITRSLGMVVLNPGTTYDYRVSNESVADVYIYYETSSYPDETFLKQEGAFDGALIEQSVNEKGVISFDVAWDEDAVELIRKYSSYVFITPEPLATAYSVLSGHLTKLYQQLSKPPRSFQQQGLTASRPTGIPIGYQYFDTTLGKPIWHNGSEWVDSTGASA